MKKQLSVPKSNSQRLYAEELYEDDRIDLRSKTDRTLAVILPLQLIATIYAAIYFVPPIDVVFPSDSARITITIAGGFLILVYPFYRVTRFRGSKWNCYSVAVAQMLISGVFAVVSNGALEAYFHLIAAMALIAFYREWRVMMFGMTVFTADKIIRSYFLPNSIAHAFNEGNINWINHLGWLYFTGILLTASSIRRANEMWAIALRTAESGAANARFRAVVQQTDESIAMIEPETFRVIESNSNFRNLIGSVPALNGDSETDFVLAEEDPIWGLIEQKTNISDSSTQAVFMHEAEYKRTDGTIIPIEYSVFLIDVGGERAVSFSARDISERKKHEMALQEAYDELEIRVIERTRALAEANEKMSIEAEKRELSEARLREAWVFLSLIIDEIPMPIYVKDENRKYVIANRAICALQNIAFQDWVGKTDNEMDTPILSFEQFEEDDTEILAKGLDIMIPQTCIKTQDGQPNWYQVIKKRVISPGSEDKYILGIATDFTERVKIESQLRHAQKMESIGQLSAGIAHEINTPTQFVGDNMRFVQEAFKSISDIVEDYGRLLSAVKDRDKNDEHVARIEELIEKADLGYLNEEVPLAIDQALEGVTRISEIVRSMREFAHPGSSEKKAIDLNNAIQSTITVAQNKWKYIADVITHFDNELPMVPCFEGEINQVVLNIIVNASHAIEDVVGDGANSKGEIKITTRKAEGDWVEVLIADSGSGMPPEVQARIFDPFFTTKGVGKGTGQGLAISHNVVVDKHAGQLIVDSEQGKGTTFTIRLPLDSVPKASQIGGT